MGDDHRFLEVNPRLQVEHPVTEMITGLDLVELQLGIAAGQGLGLAQEDIVPRGHAIEARLYAEDAGDGFLPSSGVVRRIKLPQEGLRVDSGVAAGDAVPPYYDPMIAKLIAHGGDRAEALAALRAGLAGASVLGVETNLSFLRALLAHPRVVAGELDNGLIDRELAALGAGETGASDAAFALAAYLKLLEYRHGPATDPWTRLARFTGWRQGGGETAPTRKPSLEVRIGEKVREVAFSALDREGYLAVRIDETIERLRVDPGEDDEYHVSIGKRALTMVALVDGEAVYLDGPTGALTARVSLYAAGTGAAAMTGEGRVLAPVMGQVTKVHIDVGDRVSAGDILVVQESMKMELHLTAPCDGVVAELGCAEGEMIARHSVVAEIRPHQEALAEP
jgi:3-methylcrotonyl-CoA carboxylase alpha subunit